MRKSYWIAAPLFVAVAACSGGSSDEEAWGGDKEWGGDTEWGADAKAEDAASPDDAVGAEPSEPAAKKPPAKTSGAPALAGYAGKYPYDEIDGKSIWQHPAYLKAIEVVDDARHIKWVKDDGVTSGPIENRAGKTWVWACERHNCTRNWTVKIDNKGGPGEVCFHEDENGHETHTRYTADGPMVMQPEEEC